MSSASHRPRNLSDLHLSSVSLVLPPDAMFNSMTPPQVNSYGEPCCLRPLPSQGVPGLGTEGECVYQSLRALRTWQNSYLAPGSLPPYPTLVCCLQEDFETPCLVGLESGIRAHGGLTVSSASPHPSAPLHLSLFSRMFWLTLLPPSQLYVGAPGLWVCQGDQRLCRG